MSKLIEFLKKAPKTELHSHLHGSIPFEVLEELVKMKNITDEKITKKLANMRHHLGSQDLSACFDYFSVVHTLVNDMETIGQITDMMIDSFVKENVVYLEIRTTPRDCAESGLTSDIYMETIVDHIRKAEKRHPSVIVKLILSVNRTLFNEAGLESLETHMQNLSRYARLYEDVVVGLDVSGDPTKGDMILGLSVLQRWLKNPETRDESLAKLGLTIHAGEVDNEKEIDAILDFEPDRIGHGCHLTKSQIQRVVAKEKPHVEFCPTSNRITMQLPFMEDHHFALWARSGKMHIDSIKKKKTTQSLLFKDLGSEGVNYSISTDDSGLFATTNTAECQKFIEAFRLDVESFWLCQRRSIHASFAPKNIKEKLLNEVFSEEEFFQLLVTSGLADEVMNDIGDFGETQWGVEDLGDLNNPTDDGMDSDEGQ